jgi:hypothetical protein
MANPLGCLARAGTQFGRDDGRVSVTPPRHLDVAAAGLRRLAFDVFPIIALAGSSLSRRPCSTATGRYFDYALSSGRQKSQPQCPPVTGRLRVAEQERRKSPYRVAWCRHGGGSHVFAAHRMWSNARLNRRQGKPALTWEWLREECHAVQDGPKGKGSGTSGSITDWSFAHSNPADSAAQQLAQDGQQERGGLPGTLRGSPRSRRLAAGAAGLGSRLPRPKQPQRPTRIVSAV